MATCRIIRDKKSNQITSVLSPTGAESKLYAQIESLPQVKSKEDALRIWAKVYTPAFKKWFSDSNVKDENNEPILVYKKKGTTNRFEFTTAYIENESPYVISAKNLTSVNPEILKTENLNINSKGYIGVNDESGITDYVIFKKNNAFKILPNSYNEISNQEVDKTLGEMAHQKFNLELRKKLSKYIKGLNIEITNEDADKVLDEMNIRGQNPMSGYDQLQKILVLRDNVTDKDLLMQSANIIFTMLGKRSFLSFQFMKNISEWSEYQKYYDKYKVSFEKIKDKDKYNRFESEIDEDIYGDVFDIKKDNYWIRKQVVITFIAQALEHGLDNEYLGEKRENPDITKDFILKSGAKDRFEENVLKAFYNAIWNFLHRVFNNKTFKKLNYDNLVDIALDVADDVYKENFNKIIRAYNIDPVTQKVVDVKNVEYEIKNYQESLNNDPFAARILKTLFNLSSANFELSGSLALRKYGKILRSVNEEIHDIDGSILYDDFIKESNALVFRKWIEDTGIALSHGGRAFEFNVGVKKFIEQQKWYKEITDKFPSKSKGGKFVFEKSFIGKSEKNGETVVIMGYIEHPTKMENVNNVFSPDHGKFMPKRYQVDFFLRTVPYDKNKKAYPQMFGNYFKDWKEIFEAKIKMGRTKDLNDLIFFVPFVKDKYKLKNKGFRFFTLKEDIVTDEEFFEDAALLNPTENVHLVDLDIEGQKNIIANDALTQIALALKNSFNINYNMISKKDAITLTEESQNPYTGQNPSFYYQGELYFINELQSTEQLLHEFSHPFISAIRESNPNLYNKLVFDLKNTAIGKKLLDESLNEYPGFDSNHYAVTDEMLVKALTNAAEFINKKEQSSSEMKSIVQRIILGIKKVLRKLFGKKIKIEKLNPLTNLKELAEMLNQAADPDNNVSFNVNTSIVTEDKVVQYLTDTQNFAKDILNIEGEEVIKIINSQYELIRSHILKVRDDENYEGLKYILAPEQGTGLYDELQQGISKVQTLTNTDESIEELLDSMEFQKKAALALTGNLIKTNKLIKHIYKHINLMKESPNNKENLIQITYYNNLLMNWKTFIDDTKKTMREAGVQSDSDIGNLVGNISDRIDDSTTIINKVFEKGLVDILSEQFDVVNDRMTELWEQRKAKLVAREAPKSQIEKEYNDYKKYLISKDKMKEYLKGEMGDANAFNSFLEGYMYNNDPIISSFGVYLRNNLTEIMNESDRESNKFLNSIKSDLKDAGYNPNNLEKFWKKYLFIDEDVTKNDEGNIEKFEVWTMLNPYKNYRLKMAIMQQNVDEAKQKYSSTRDKKDFKIYADLVEKYRNHKKLFFNNTYLDSFYEPDKMMENEIGREALKERDSILEEISLLQDQMEDEYDEFQNYDVLDQLWKKYRLLFSEYGKDEEGKAKAKLLKEYRNAKNEFYDWVELPNVFNNAYLNFIEKLEQKLSDEEFEQGTSKYDNEYNRLKQEWIDKNTIPQVSQEWYDLRQQQFDIIKDITKDLPVNVKESINIEEAYEKIFDAVTPFRDDDNEPNALEMDEKRISDVKQLQYDIEAIKEEYAGLTGLTTLEYETLQNYFRMLRNKQKLTKSQFNEFKTLSETRSELGLSKLQKKRLFAAFERLSELQKTDATIYYLDEINNIIQKENLSSTLENSTDKKEFDNELANKLLTKDFSGVLASLRRNKGFKKWFDKNHLANDKVDRNGDEYTSYKRVYVWSKVKPQDEFEEKDGVVRSTGPSKFYEKTKLYDAQGNEIDEIFGKPSYKFRQKVVKKEYHTPKEIGKTVDVKGNWLPKSYSEMQKIVAKNPQLEDPYRYINMDYENMDKNSSEFKLLEKVKKYHINNQKGLNRNSKLGYDVPRYRLERLGLFQRKNIVTQGKEKLNGWTAFVKDTKSKFVKTKEDWEVGLNPDDQHVEVNLDLLSDKTAKIPISGRYQMDLDEVSLDLLSAVEKYQLSAKRQLKLIEISPIAEALSTTLNEQGVIDTVNGVKKIIKKTYQNYGLKTSLKKEGKSVRAKGIDNIIERDFYGINITGRTKDQAWLHKSVGWLQKRASFGFFALNIPSALKNRYGAIFQSIIETAAMKYMTPFSYAQGRVWSAKAQMEITSQLYKVGSKTLNAQLVFAFDAIQGYQEERKGDAAGRSLLRDVVSGSWVYSPRKFMEMGATLQAFGGMMYNVNVPKVDKDGNQIKVDEITQSVPYAEAFELVDGQLSLKEGLDPEYDVNGKKFFEIKNRMSAVTRDLQGAYAAEDQPEANRYLMFRMASYMRKYFTTMMMRRFGMKLTKDSNKIFGYSIDGRYNMGLAEVQLGYYIETFKFAGEVLKRGTTAIKYMTPDQANALKKVILEFAMLNLTVLAYGLVGYNDDDEDRWKKMKKLSGPLPGFFVEDDREFKLGGYLQQHLLYLLMNIRAENEQFIPLSKYGLKDLSQMKNVSSVVFGPTTDTYVKIITDMNEEFFGEGKKSRYKKDVGPYVWQKEDSFKIWNNAFKAFGITGSSMDPYLGARNFNSFRQRFR